MTPEQEFVQHWHDRLTGLALRGLVHDTDERPRGPHGAGAYALKVPDKVEALIRKMFEDAKRLLDKPVNGVKK